MRKSALASLVPASILASILLSAIVLLALLTSCGPGNYTSQLASYPPGSDPATRDWQYRMAIDAATYGQTVLRNTKRVRVTIRGSDWDLLLDDRFQLTSASIRAKIAWKQPDYVEVRLFEEGNEFTADRDSYNEELVASGPRELETLAYRRDPGTGKFRRIK